MVVSLERDLDGAVAPGLLRPGGHEVLEPDGVLALGVAGVVGSAALAEVTMRSGLIDVPGLPIPSEVLESVGVLLQDEVFWEAIRFTALEWMLGLGIATGAFADGRLDRPAELARLNSLYQPSVTVGATPTERACGHRPCREWGSVRATRCFS